MADTTPETKASLDLVEDAYQFNLKSLIEQHEKTLASMVTQQQLQLAQLNQISLQALQNAVTVANQLAQSNADSQNLVNKQAIRHADLAIATEWRGQNLSDAAAGENMENTVADTAQMSNPPVIKP